MTTTDPRRTRTAIAGCVLTALALAAPRLTAEAVPALAKAALEKSFPGATIVRAEREREEGAQYFEVDLRQDGQEFSAEVSPEGVIGEVETKVAAKALPQAVKARLKELAAGTEVKSAEKHEVRGVPLYGVFVALAEPQTVYEVTYRAPGAKRNAHVVVHANGSLVRANRDDDDDDDDDDD